MSGTLCYLAQALYLILMGSVEGVGLKLHTCSHSLRQHCKHRRFSHTAAGIYCQRDDSSNVESLNKHSKRH